MSGTENRVVNMQFNNGTFMKSAADTSKALADLDKATSAAGKSSGLMDLGNQMDQVAIKASGMQVATVAAIGTIASKITALGLTTIKGLTFDPIASGFHEYEENLNKLNTIMNATGQSEERVQGILDNLNRYSDKTIYSFSNMTSSIQKFVNAGVPLGQSVESIKGIANAAAYSGASTEEANRAMYAFSQTMSTGFMMLNDWQQIDNANMGTMEFKNQLLEAGEAAGTLTKQGKNWVTESGKMVNATSGWRDGLQEQWATTEVVNTALSKYTDTTTKLGKAATESAMEYRTFTAFMDSFKESLGSGWAKIFSSLIGGLDDATTFWTTLANSITGVTEKFFNFTATALKTWRTMGGFEKTIQGFKNLFAPLAAIFHVVGAALREAFPSGDKGAGKALYGLSAGFEALTRPLQVLADVIEGTTPMLVLFFKAIHLGGALIGAAASKVGDFVKDLLGMVSIKVPSGGGFIGFIKDLAREIGNAITKVDNLIQKGASLTSAFGSVSIDMPTMPDMPKMSMPKMPKMPALPTFGADGGAAKKVTTLSASVTGLTHNVLGLGEATKKTEKASLFNPSEKADTSKFDAYSTAAKEMTANVGASAEGTKSVLVKMGEGIAAAWDAVVNFISGISVEDVVSAFNSAAFATMGFYLISFIRTIKQFTENIGGAINTFSSLANVANRALDQTGQAVKAFQMQARAELLKSIALALLALAAALFILSLIPADKLAKSLVALGITAFIMSKSMSSMASTIEKMDGAKAGVKMIGLSIAITALAFAMVLLATAFLIMNKVEWESVAKGLITMFVAMKLIQSVGAMAEHAAKNMVAGAAAIALVAASMLALAVALLAFKLVDWGSMGKAAAALAGITLAVGLLALIPYEGIAKVGLALLGASVGMIAIAAALVLFGLVKWESIGKAAVVLLLITASLAALMYVAQPMSVAMFFALGAGMLYLSFALKNLNDVEWASIAKLAVVMLALLVALSALTAVLYFLAPVVPVLLIFAAALLAVGLAMLAFSAALAIAMSIAAGGAAAFAALAIGAAVAIATFMQTLAHEAPIMKKAFLAILKELIDTIVQAVPMVIDGIKRLWEAVKKEFQGNDKKKASGDAAKGWISSASDGIESKIPTIVAKVGELLVKFLVALRSKAADIAEAGVGLIVAIINGISRKIGDVVTAAYNLVIKFAQGISKNIIHLVNAGINLIGNFLHQLADAIRRSSGVIGSGITDVADAFRDVGVDMIQGMINGIEGMLDDVLGAVTSVVGKLPGWARKLLGESSPSKVFYDIGKFMVAGLTEGIQNNDASAIQATAAMITGQIALSEDLLNGMIQRLDQRALAARGRAEGLAAAAKQAQAAANKTKGQDNRGDDQAANAISRQAKRAKKQADAAEKKAKQEKAAEARKRKWEAAGELERAKIKSDDANKALQNVKQAEQDAQAQRAEANALAKQARAKDVTAEQRKRFRRQANRLRQDARESAARANSQLEKARRDAADAMEWQAKAAKTAAANYQERFDAEAKAAEDAKNFEKLTAAEKAVQRRQEATDLQKEAEKNLAAAKEKAKTDIEAANALADLAFQQAENARQLLEEAIGFEGEGGSGQVLNLRPTEAAALAANQYADLYSAGAAAAAASGHVEFNQYNQSPEALNDATIYRQTNNLVTFAADQLAPKPNG